MRQFLILASLLALAVAVFGQTDSYPVIYTVTDKDRTCIAPENCTVVAPQCCGGVTCNFTAVNVVAARTIIAQIQESVNTTCANIQCPATLMPCALPSTTCALSSNVAGGGLCTIVDRPPAPVPSTTTPPPCAVSFDRSTCATSCVASNLANPQMCQSNNQTINCINNCNRLHAQCTLTSAGTAASTCGYVSQNPTEWQVCLRQCSPTTLPPAPSPQAPQCIVNTNPNTCALVCTTPSLTVPITPSCNSSDDSVNCKNRCYTSSSQCGPNTNGGCSFQTSATLTACLNACVPLPSTAPTTVQPPQCYVGTDAQCGATCTTTPPPVNVQQCTATDAFVRCKNACISQWSRCSSTTSLNSQCGFLPTNDTAYRACISLCAPPSPVADVPTPPRVEPSTVTCYAGTDAQCGATCTTTQPPVNVQQCTATDALVRCKNACISEWTRCSASSSLSSNSLCSFIPTNDTGYRNCISKCSPTTTSPVTSTCVLTRNSMCESICVLGTATTAIITCQPNDPTIACVNECKSALTTCQSLSSVPGTNQGGCGLVPSNFTLYSSCVEKCRLPPTPQTPPPTKCMVQIAPNTCREVCVADTGATYTRPACTADTLTACLNACQADSECSLTPNGCSYFPRNATAYRDCTSKCYQEPIPTAAPPQCFKTGCSGEICSSVQMQSDCSFTCEKACYRTATCASVSVSSNTVAGTSCAWLQTPELSSCLRNCTPVVASPVTSIPRCKITGCSRELCVPTTSPDSTCTALAEPSCETKCLSYAQCTTLPTSLTLSGATSTACGWVPDPANPGPYAECLTRCKQVNNPCFVSGCGAECATVASLRPCPSTMTCIDRCNYAYSTCNLTSSGTCAFLPTNSLRDCIASCSPSPVVASPATVCPPNVQAVQCLVDPCSFTRCPAYPNARCTSDRCGTCRAVFDVNGQIVNCDDGCRNLGCRECLGNTACAYCNGNYSVTGSTSFTTFGVCVSANSDVATKCLASNSRLLSAGSTCPSVTSSGTSEATDPTPFQNEAAASTLGVRVKFVIVITLVVNQSATGTDAFHLVKMFVDLIGTATPDANDRAEVCTILKDALLKVDATVPRDLLTCSLAEKLSVKRDTSYVADLSYPASNNGPEPSAASTLMASFVAIAVALVAALF